MLPPSPNLAYLLLGANLGERATTLQAARHHLTTSVGEEVAASPLYESAPWGGAAVADQPPYLNQALVVRTLLDPFRLMRTLLVIETALGRRRDEPWQARTLDLDLLLFERFEIDFAPELVIPHPRLTQRRFALQPLADVAPDVLVPGTGHTVAQLLAACPDPLAVRRLPADG